MLLIDKRIGDGKVAGNTKGFMHGCVIPFILGTAIHPMMAILYVYVVGGLYLFYFGMEKAEAKLMFAVCVVLEVAFFAPVAIDLLVGGVQ